MGIKQRRKMCRLYLDLSSWTLKRSSVLRVASVILIIETAGCVVWSCSAWCWRLETGDPRSWRDITPGDGGEARTGIEVATFLARSQEQGAVRGAGRR